MSVHDSYIQVSDYIEVYLYIGLLFSNKKEQIREIYNIMS